ncbi:MAG: cupin domain-containing protein [Deinococcales bacterium]
MKASVRSIQTLEPFRLPNRSVREVFSQRNGLATACSFRTVDLEPQDETAPRVPHVHEHMEEIIVVAQGRGALWVEGGWTRVAEGDAWIVPPGARHATVNPGPEVLRLYCFFSSATPEADYREIADHPLDDWRAFLAGEG